jgi:phosphoglycerate dehydrogenase-like enzyme
MVGAQATLRALLVGKLVLAYREHLSAALTTAWDLVAVGDGAPLRGSTDAVLAIRWRAGDRTPEGLRLFQVAAAGYDSIDLAAIPPQVPVCNAYGHEPAIGEYVLMTMLAWTHRLLPTERSFRAGDWSMGSQPAPTHGELAGSSVLVVGTGRIGRAVADRLAAVGCRVVGANRTVGRPPAGFAALHPLADLDALLPEADFVVVACALDDGTRGLLDARRLALLKPTAVVVNVARGPIIEEAALFGALTERRIGGAILDVWWRYPTHDEPRREPSALPFTTLDNVIMTPHCSAWTDGLFRRRAAEMADNLDRLAEGRPLRNVFRTAAG